MRLIGTHSIHSDCQEPARIFTGRPDARRTRPEQVALFGRAANCFSERLASAVGFFFDHTKKRELFPGLGSSSPSAATRRRSDPARERRVQSHESRLGNRYSIPFRVGACTKQRVLRLSPVALRRGYTAIDRRSRGALLLFGLRGSRLNVCYCHRDLRGRPLQPHSRATFCATGLPAYSFNELFSNLIRSAFSIHFEREGIGPTLQRHPFSGPIDSAGE